MQAVSPSYFLFQAEDGIRDFHVTGVQTCALPISSFGSADRSFVRTSPTRQVRRRRIVPQATTSAARSSAAAIVGSLAGPTGASAARSAAGWVSAEGEQVDDFEHAAALTASEARALADGWVVGSGVGRGRVEPDEQYGLLAVADPAAEQVAVGAARRQVSPAHGPADQVVQHAALSAHSAC